MPQTLILPDEAATAALAARLAPLLTAGDVVTLRGDLGAGKTALARSIIRHLAGDPAEEVPSPTFTLVQTYEHLDPPVWHFDLYRLSDPGEVVELGWEEARQACALVEWPERLGPLLPRDRLDIELTLDGPTARRAVLNGHGTWGPRLEPPPEGI
ncbi:tRNA (adenosine(37)-N6)-threonylcarbamoyltransferase complex ATPase subunit type 1 TsaE [Niveispirillum fermenti]|uniref:tRNA (adenosine(37)-N6)-threonylcarbamoyltransferase complex ATPase subunit type 1 TsaE n=1 Tax=Niveispirillum fermenti TaxID=1233113 RepID=UPI003A8AECD9